MDWILDFYNYRVVAQFLTEFQRGMLSTLGISMVALVLSLMLGTGTALMSQSPNLVLRKIADGYIAVIRSTPLLVQIYMVYFALPALPLLDRRLTDLEGGALQPEGALAVRLSNGEALLLGNLQGNSDLLDRLAENFSRELPAEVYQVPRADSSAWFMVTGRLAPEMLAKLCGVDLSSKVFPQLEVAQTSVARTNAIVLRWDVGQTLAYHVFPGAALAEYLWDCLMDAMVEYGGRPAGLEAVWGLLAADR